MNVSLEIKNYFSSLRGKLEWKNLESYLVWLENNSLGFISEYGIICTENIDGYIPMIPGDIWLGDMRKKWGVYMGYFDNRHLILNVEISTNENRLIDVYDYINECDCTVEIINYVYMEDNLIKDILPRYCLLEYLINIINNQEKYSNNIKCFLWKKIGKTIYCDLIVKNKKKVVKETKALRYETIQKINKNNIIIKNLRKF